MSLEELKEKRRCREILLKCGISKEDIERGLKRGDYKEIYYEDDVLAWVENAKEKLKNRIRTRTDNMDSETIRDIDEFFGSSKEKRMVKK